MLAALADSEGGERPMTVSEDALLELGFASGELKYSTLGDLLLWSFGSGLLKSVFAVELLEW